LEQFTDIRFRIIQISEMACSYRADNHAGGCGIFVNARGQTEFQAAVNPLIAEGTFLNNTTWAPSNLRLAPLGHRWILTVKSFPVE
jgi:hypothetical protein